MSQDTVLKHQKEFEKLAVEETLRKAFKLFSVEQIALASSLAAEDQVLTDIILSIEPKASIFTLDTGRLPQETYDVMEETMKRYSFHYEILFPNFSKLEDMVSAHGPNLFYESRERRTLCCQIRKVEPLQRKLKTLKAWVCGLRRQQSVTRTQIQKLEWDETNGLFKINPLADWSQEQVWDYIRQKLIPYNKLHDQGFVSIGCAPCTRAVKPGEDIRAGRWWWEPPEHKECGLHRRPSSSK